jgi:hypothetical protein
MLKDRDRGHARVGAKITGAIWLTGAPRSRYRHSWTSPHERTGIFESLSSIRFEFAAGQTEQQQLDQLALEWVRAFSMLEIERLSPEWVGAERSDILKLVFKEESHLYSSVFQLALP